MLKRAKEQRTYVFHDEQENNILIAFSTRDIINESSQPKTVALSFDFSIHFGSILPQNNGKNVEISEQIKVAY